MVNLFAHITSPGWRTAATACATAGIALLAAVFPAQAQDSAATDQTRVRLVSAVTAVGDAATLPFGVEIALQPGWKTYWRSPGDAGFPPTVDIAGSKNVAAAALAFPAPHRFELFGLQTFGYSEKVVLPLRVTPERAGEAVSLKVRLRYLICEQICIPYDHDLRLDLPAGSPTLTADAAAISEAEAQIPDDGSRARWRLTDLRLEGDRLIAAAASDGVLFKAPDLLVEAPNGLLFGKTIVTLENGNRAARFEVPVERLEGAPDPASSELTLTVVDGPNGLEQRAIIANFTGTGAGDGSAALRGLWPMLLVALIGGLILNVMPCVLPVLLLKLGKVLEQAGAPRREIRAGFVASAGGIVSVFILLAAILIALKRAGMEIGWGIQFQQPVFLGVLAAICLAFAANVWGFFRVPVPALAGGLANMADAAVVKKPRRAAFLEGVLAAVLATPCSAPFVGTAVGFALSQGPVEIATIFVALGLGLALPYLAVAAWPALVAWLPRPGRWMIWLKRLLGLSLVGMALWLLMIMAQQTGWLRKSAVEDGIAWQTFDQSAIAAEIGKGQVVFVDVTAEWCLTCRANKEFVLKRDPVLTALQGAGITPMLADWTKPDPVISAYLASFGRYGIPLNVVYGPKAPQGIVLPELLTPEAVMSALQAAR